MIRAHLSAAGLVAVWTCFAAIGLAAADPPKKPADAQDSNEQVKLTARVLLDKAEIAQRLGVDPGFPMILIDVTVTPRGESKFRLDRDDFTLISRKDGQRSQPLAPGQIAGTGKMMVRQTSERGGGGFGVGTMLGGIGSGGPAPTTNEVILNTETPGAGTAEKAKEDPLLASLKEKVLPEKEIEEPATGLLYFLFDGKLKSKDLALVYKSPAGRMVLEFPKQ